MTTKLIKNAGNAGELSAYMDGRTDINKYYNGWSKLINATVLPHGGVTKRPGTIYKATAAGRANLVPFEFSVDDALILEWTNLLLRFYKDQAQIFKPYGSEDLSAIGGIVAHYKCDDNAASTTVVDADGATHNGNTQANTSTLTTTDAEGTANSALDLGGADYVTISDHNDFSFGDGATDSPFSLALWVKYTSTAAVQTLISKYLPPNDNEWNFFVQADDTVRLFLTDESAGAAVSVVTTATLSDGWHFLVATSSGSVDSDVASGQSGDRVGIKIYIDYELAATTVTQVATNYVAMENLTADVIIGADSVNQNIWEDKIDNAAIFNKELTHAEIASLAGNDQTTVQSITSPYTTAQAFSIHYTQSADVMYIAHEDIHPKKLSRLSDQIWDIRDVPFTGGPFLNENTIATSLVGFARTGGAARSEYYFPTGSVGTLTASGAGNSPFKSTHVGALWLVKHTRDNDNSTDTFAKDTNVVPTLETYASGAIFIKSEATVTFEPVATGEMAQLWRKAGNGTWQKYRSFRAASAFTWTENEDNVLYAMTRSNVSIEGTLTAKEAVNRGIVKITAFTSPTVVTVEVIDKVLSNNTNDNAVTTSMWAEGAWSDYRGYPRTVGFHEDRLWWWSSTNNPDTGWGSKTGDYESHEFTDTGLDDDAVIVTIGDNEVSQIQWMMPRQVMAIGAANREYRLSASNPDDPITPTDKKATPQTGFSSSDVQPVMLNDSIFFLQRQGKKLGAMKFDSVTENFDVDDASLLAYGLLDSAPTTMSVQRSPDSIIRITRTDGIMPTFTYEPKEEVAGWGRTIFGNSADVETATGFVESSAVIHGSTEDEIWVCVRRVINSSTVYYIELLAPRSWGSDIEDAKFVDSLVTYDSTASSAMTGLDHLEGETVSVFADGVVFDDAVVASGAITLKKGGTVTTASTVQMGLPYTMKARSMRLAVPQQVNTLQTRIKRVISVTARYIRSMLGSAGTEYGGTEYLTDIKATYSTESADTPVNNRAAQGGFDENAYVTIVSDDPVPFTVLSVVTEVDV